MQTDQTTNEVPVFDRTTGAWTCPTGYAHPRCSGCGHNFYSLRPMPKENGKALDGGLCQWCFDEQEN